MAKKKSRKTVFGSDSRPHFDLARLIGRSRRTRRNKALLPRYAPTAGIRFASKALGLRANLSRPRPLPFLLFALAIGALSLSFASGSDYSISCRAPSAIDGDTFRCGGERIRLAGIDAPEMPGHCRPGRRCTPGDPYAARRHLDKLTRGHVECRPVDTDPYGRTVARCRAAGEDLSCAMIASGHAVRRYGFITCL